MSLGRRLLFTLLTLALFSLLIEGGAWLAESRLYPPEVMLPIPAAMGNRDVPHEVWERFAKQDERALQLVQDGENPWGLPPSQVMLQGSALCRTNSLGLRGPEPDTLTGTHRLLTTGDSSVFGYGVEEDQVFSAVAAAALDDAWADRGVQVDQIIGAVPGFTSTMSRVKLEGTIEIHEPTWVVIANLWSDLAYGDQDPRPAPHPLHALATYRLMVRALGPWLSPRVISWIDPAAMDDRAATDQRLADYRAELTTMADMAIAQGASPAFLILPAPVDQDAIQVPMRVRGHRAVMREVAAAYGAPLMDGPAWFEEQGAGLDAFFDVVHPSVTGHAMLGELVARGLLMAHPEPPPGR